MNPVTYLLKDGNKIPVNTLSAEASSFGMLAPKEISQVNIYQLSVPDVAAISNIRLALIDTGGIVFNNSTFGVDTRTFLDPYVKPETFFQGVSDKTAESPYNFSVNNLNRFASVFVYLNVKIPIAQDFIAGTIRCGKN